MKEQSLGVTSQEIQYFTYLFAAIVLIVAAVIFFVEALRTTSIVYRAALTVETFVALVAGFIYYKFILCNDCPSQITSYRYLDWFITTPFLILALLIVLHGESEEPFPWDAFALVVALDFLMLFAGFLAQRGCVPKFLGWLVGSAALIGLLGVIFVRFDAGDNALFWFFAVVWILYGIVFYLPDPYQDVAFNILDVVAKGGFGLITWAFSVGLANNALN